MRKHMCFLLPVIITVVLQSKICAFADESEKYLQHWERTHQWESRAADGFRLLQEKNYNAAAIQFIKAIDSGCENGRIRYQLALCYDHLGRYELAVDYYLESINKLEAGNEPNKSNYLYNANLNLGFISMKQGSYGEAENRLKTALSINPENANALANLGFIYSRKKDYKNAVDAYLKSLSIQPGAGGDPVQSGCFIFKKRRNRQGEGKIRQGSSA